MRDELRPDMVSQVHNRMDGELSEIKSASIAIIGLGLIGGSLALSLKNQSRKLLGVDKDPAVVKKALDRQMVDEACTDPAALLPAADLVVIAVPLSASLELIKSLPQLHPGAPIVIDVGSTKSAVVQAMSTLPGRFEAIGGHPMCGKEVGTVDNAEASLFEKAVFALVATEHSSPHALKVAKELVRLIGARPLFLDAETHDSWVAATSHMPHMLATALALSTPLECAPLVGPGFISTSRLAAGSAEMKTDIFATNRQEILEALERYSQQLETLTSLLAEGDFDSLRCMLDRGAEHRQAILECNYGIQ